MFLSHQYCNIVEQSCNISLVIGRTNYQSTTAICNWLGAKILSLQGRPQGLNLYFLCYVACTENQNCLVISVRERMWNLWLAGESFSAIASCTGVTSKTVSNIVRKFTERGHLFPLKPGGKERQIATPNVVEYIEFLNLFKPSITAFDIQEAH